MIELRHMDVRHFVNMECSHLANGCTTKCVCIDLMLFPYLSCLGAIICDKDTIGFVSVCISAQFVTLCHGCGKLCNRSPGGREPKWMVHVKRPCDVAKRYTSSGLTICCHDDTGVHDGSDGSNRVDRGNPQEYGEDLRCPLRQREWGGGEGKGGGAVNYARMQRVSVVFMVLTNISTIRAFKGSQCNNTYFVSFGEDLRCPPLQREWGEWKGGGQ